MSNLLSWFIIGILTLNFGACVLLSYLGTGLSTAAKRYPRIEQQSTTKSPKRPAIIRTGSTGGGSSISGGGPSSGK
jgi:hypothetical protein